MKRSRWLVALAGLALVWTGAAMAQTPDTRCGAVNIFGPDYQTIDMGAYYLGHPYIVRTGAGCDAYQAFAASGSISCSGDDYFWLKGNVSISGNNGGCRVDNRDATHPSQGSILSWVSDVLPPPPPEKCNLAYFKARADLIFKNDGTVVDGHTGADVTSQYARTSSTDPNDTTRLLYKGSEYWVTCAPGATQGQAALDHKILYFEGCGFRAVNMSLGTTGDGTPAQYVPWNVTIAADRYLMLDGLPQAISYHAADTKAVLVSAGDIYIGTLGTGCIGALSRFRGSICANDNVILKGGTGPSGGTHKQNKPQFLRVTTDTPPFMVASQPPVSGNNGNKSVLFEGTITAFNDGSDPKWNIGTQIFWDQAFVFDCNTYKPMGCYTIGGP